MGDRPRESAGARLGFDGAVQGRLQENEVGEGSRAVRQVREAAPKFFGGEAHEG